MKTKYCNLSDEELFKILEKKEQYIDSLWNVATLSWEEYCKEVEKTDINQIYSEKILRMIPEFTKAGKFDLKCRMSLEEFKSDCKCKYIISDDGEGYYGTKDSITNIPADPSTFYNDWNREDFEYIYWYNK